MIAFLTSSPCIYGAPRAILNPENSFVDNLFSCLPKHPRCLFICSAPDDPGFTDRVSTEMAAAFESDKDTSSVTIPDCANPDEMEKPVPVMIDISNCEALAGLYDLDKLEEPLVIAIMTDAPDKKLTLQFIQYLTK